MSIIWLNEMAEMSVINIIQDHFALHNIATTYVIKTLYTIFHHSVVIIVNVIIKCMNVTKRLITTKSCNTLWTNPWWKLF